MGADGAADSAAQTASAGLPSATHPGPGRDGCDPAVASHGDAMGRARCHGIVLALVGASAIP